MRMAMTVIMSCELNYVIPTPFAPQIKHQTDTAPQPWYKPTYIITIYCMYNQQSMALSAEQPIVNTTLAMNNIITAKEEPPQPIRKFTTPSSSK